jgi:CheY-like chemotaxis protein
VAQALLNEQPMDGDATRCRGAGATEAPMATRILLVDDNADVAVMLADLLRERGFTVEVVIDGIAALERLEAKTFDLIVSDVHMPRLDGVGLHRELVRRHSAYANRLILVTGSFDAVPGPTRVPVIYKPFEFTDLTRLIDLKLAAGAA